VVAKVAGGSSPLLQISQDERTRVGRVAELFSEEELTRFLQILLRSYNDISYKADQRFHLELALLKLVHAQRLLPVEELLSGMQAQSSRAAASSSPSAKPLGSPAPKPRTQEEIASRAAASPPQVSPFEKDRARKSGGTEMAASSVAVMEAPEIPGKDAPVEAGSAALDRIRSAVLAALEDGGHRMLAATLEAGDWQVSGGELLIKAHAAASLLEMAMTADAKKIASSAASSAAGRALKLRAESLPGTNGGAAPAPAARSAATGGSSGRQRAADDPIVRKVQEKFGAEIRTVIDYRDKQRQPK
jgi:DNA polymerase III subunit gamma/tau